MIKMTMWFLAAGVAALMLLGVYEMATAPSRAHMKRVEAVTRDANARIAKDRAAQERQWSAPPKTPPTKMPDIEKVFGQVCASLRFSGAVSCDMHSKIFSTSYIDATFPGGLLAAQAACERAAQIARAPVRAFAGWQLKLFSPFGNDRPMAVCIL